MLVWRRPLDEHVELAMHRANILGRDEAAGAASANSEGHGLSIPRSGCSVSDRSDAISSDSLERSCSIGGRSISWASQATISGRSPTARITTPHVEQQWWSSRYQAV